MHGSMHMDRKWVVGLAGGKMGMKWMVNVLVREMDAKVGIEGANVGDKRSCRIGYHQHQISIDQARPEFLPTPYARTDGCK